MPDEPVLREKAREAIRCGKMPSRKADRTYGGRGSRVACSVCDELITPNQSEIVIEFRRAESGHDDYYLHVRCLAAWEFERTKLLA